MLVNMHQCKMHEMGDPLTPVFSPGFTPNSEVGGFTRNPISRDWPSL